jgi:hypothetical protein
MIAVIDELTMADTGKFLFYDGKDERRQAGRP